MIDEPARVPVETKSSHLDRLQQLADLYNAGLLTPEEFEHAKSRVLDE